MSTPDKDPQNSKHDSRFNGIMFLIRRVAVLFLGLLAFIVAFVCCCTGTGLSLLATNEDGNVSLSIAILVGVAIGLVAFVLVVKSLWPRS